MAALGARRLSAASCSTSYSSSSHSTRALPRSSHATAAHPRHQAPALATHTPPHPTLATPRRQEFLNPAAPHSSSSSRSWRLRARRGRKSTDVPEDDFADDETGEGDDDFDEDQDVIIDVLGPAAAAAKQRSATEAAEGAADESVDYEAEAEEGEEEEEWEEWDIDGEVRGSSIVDDVLDEDANSQDGGWDSALVDFPVEQDEVTAREWDTKDAGFKRRLNPPGAVMDRTEIEEFVPDVEPEPEARQEGDQFKLLTAADTDKLVTNRQGYQSFNMHTFELLVAETPDGRLDLGDSFIFDSAQDMYAKPEVEGQLPSGPGRYQVIPWTEEQLGDTMKGKEATSKILKLYFIGIANTNPYTVDMEAVYVFDGSTRVMTAARVQRTGNDIIDPIMRIRPEGIMISDSSELPPFQAVAAGWGGQDQIYASEEDRNEKMEELDQGLDEEIDDIPDLPAADMV